VTLLVDQQLLSSLVSPQDVDSCEHHHFSFSTVTYHVAGLFTVVALPTFSRPVGRHGHSRLWSWCGTIRSSVFLCITRRLQLLGLLA